MYSITYSKDALKTLQSMPRNLSIRIRDKVAALAEDPFAPNNNVTKLQGREGFRLRVGDWRVIYDIQHDTLVIHVVTIGPRGGVYQ